MSKPLLGWLAGWVSFAPTALKRFILESPLCRGKSHARAALESAALAACAVHQKYRLTSLMRTKNAVIASLLLAYPQGAGLTSG
jgi:hypothetical protein